MEYNRSRYFFLFDADLNPDPTLNEATLITGKCFMYIIGLHRNF
jgi:hypothetical protein